MSRSLHTNRDFEKLEPYEGKPSRTVLRGEEGSNALDLPDSIISADGPLRELSRLLKNTSATDEEINMAVYVVIRQAETIINEATTQLENNV